LGLDYSFYEIKEVIIDEKLLKRRNAIAHGEYLSLDREEYQQLHDEMLGMMENFRTQIENNAIQKLYLRSNP
jgi:MAE_28990/MAE_18760-like HEPN